MGAKTSVAFIILSYITYNYTFITKNRSVFANELTNTHTTHIGHKSILCVRACVHLQKQITPFLTILKNHVFSLYNCSGVILTSLKLKKLLTNNTIKHNENMIT